MKFYLGTHHPNWLGTFQRPLFVSHRRLKGRRTFPRAVTSWALDSGGFSELSMYGHWQTSESDYVRAIRRYRDEIGQLAWAAPQDWMCEPHMLAKTGLSMLSHQRKTVENYLRLRDLDSDLPLIPVLQGWTLSDYLRCAEMYQRSGIDLPDQPLVGVGSVCRRQATGEIETIMAELAGLGMSLHGFGVKVSGLDRYADHLASADSMAWSFAARRSAPLPECTHNNCANCAIYADHWAARIQHQLCSVQLSLAI